MLESIAIFSLMAASSSIGSANNPIVLVECNDRQ